MMNKRAMLLSVFLAFGLLLTAVPRVAADPPPWAGVWRHHHHDDDDDDDDNGRGNYRRHYPDYDRYRNGGYRGYGGNGRYDQCSANFSARMNKDRGLINQWQGTGRHDKVVRWAYEDQAKAQRDLANCRGQQYNRSYDPYYGSNNGYDPYYRQSYDPRPSYDPYYGNGNDPYYGTNGGGFEWKRDWPLVLGTVLNGQVGVGR